ncbi:MAG: hypothetical protein WC752_04725 [Patescibacteria group bacterium]|jgi:hypothetical protein
MRKIIYLGLICAMAVSFTGCFLTDKIKDQVSDKIGEEIGEKIVSSATNSDVEVDNNKVTINTNEGTMQWGEDVSLPSNFPEDVPVYENASVTASSTTNDDSFYVTLTAIDTYANVKAYYDDAIKAEGWTIDSSSSYSSSGQSSTYIASKDNRQLTVGLYEYPGENDTYQITIAIDVITNSTEE